MDELEFAVRQYQLEVPRDLIRQGRIERDIAFPRQKLDAWMRDAVLPAIRRLWPRARFREAATWPQQVFKARAKTNELQRLRELAEALRQSARDVLAVSKIAANHGPFPTAAT